MASSRARPSGALVSMFFLLLPPWPLTTISLPTPRRLRLSQTSWTVAMWTSARTVRAPPRAMWCSETVMGMVGVTTTRGQNRRAARRTISVTDAVSWIMARWSWCCSVAPVGTIPASIVPSATASLNSFRVSSPKWTLPGRIDSLL